MDFVSYNKYNINYILILETLLDDANFIEQSIICLPKVHAGNLLKFLFSYGHMSKLNLD